MAKELLKSKVVSKFYRSQGFQNKELFWVSVEEKRAARKNNPFSKDSLLSSSSKKYIDNIRYANKQYIKNRLLSVIGTPSEYHIGYYTGDINAEYAGTYNAGYHGSWLVSGHSFIVTLPTLSKLIKVAVNSFDGLTNIQCDKVKTIGTITLYSATWIIKRRGYSFDTQKGFVATDGTVSFHGDTVHAALEGLKKKLKKVSKNNSVTLDTKITKTAFIRMTGACKPGVEDFCGRHDITKNYLKVGEVIEILHNTGDTYYSGKLEKILSK